MDTPIANATPQRVNRAGNNALLVMMCALQSGLGVGPPTHAQLLTHVQFPARRTRPSVGLVFNLPEVVGKITHQHKDLGNI